jgi:hypothetical protein
MAAEWIKFETDTLEKPEIFDIALALGWDEPDLVVCKLLRVWGWFDRQTIDGVAPRGSLQVLDRIAGAAGFAQAMCGVGWLIQVDGGLILPNFDRHNGKTAKDRALTAKRVAKHQGNAIVSGDKKAETVAKVDTNAAIVSLPLAREEKRKEGKRKEEKNREENINSKTTTKTITAPAATEAAIAPATATEKPTAASDDVFPPGIDVQIINDFKALRKKLHLPITKTALDGLQREGAKAGLSLEAVLKMCCERGWRGFKADWAQDDNVNRGRSSGPKFNPVAYVNRNRIRPS